MALSRATKSSGTVLNGLRLLSTASARFSAASTSATPEQIVSQSISEPTASATPTSQNALDVPRVRSATTRSLRDVQYRRKVEDKSHYRVRGLEEKIVVVKQQEVLQRASEGFPSTSSPSLSNASSTSSQTPETGSVSPSSSTVDIERLRTLLRPDEAIDDLTGRITRKVTTIVGKPVYLPDIVFKLVPNHTPKGESYDPYRATFYVPHNVTKLDVRGYLKSMYGLDVTFINTDNYFPTFKRRLPYKPRGRNLSGQDPGYKRVIVGLREPFLFPGLREDMTREERRAHDEWLDTEFDYSLLMQQLEDADRAQKGHSAVAWGGGRKMKVKEVRLQKVKMRDEAEGRVDRAAKAEVGFQYAEPKDEWSDEFKGSEKTAASRPDASDVLKTAMQRMIQAAVAQVPSSSNAGRQQTRRSSQSS